MVKSESNPYETFARMLNGYLLFIYTSLYIIIHHSPSATSVLIIYLCYSGSHLYLYQVSPWCRYIFSWLETTMLRVFHFVWMLNSSYEKNVLWINVTSEPVGYKHKLLQELNRWFKWDISRYFCFSDLLFNQTRSQSLATGQTPSHFPQSRGGCTCQRPLLQDSSCVLILLC